MVANKDMCKLLEGASFVVVLDVIRHISAGFSAWLRKSESSERSG
jgi:hypothetical protein